MGRERKSHNITKKDRFLNRKNEKFDWDNDDLSEIQVVKNQPNLVHPDIIAEFPGIETEQMFSDDVAGSTNNQDTMPSLAARA